MTIKDFLYIVKKRLLIFIIIPLVAVGACFGYLFFQDMSKGNVGSNNSSATSELVVSTLAAPTRAIVDYEVNKRADVALVTSKDGSNKDADYACKVTYDSAKNKILITVSGPEQDQAESIANEVAKASMANAQNEFKDKITSGVEYVCIHIPAYLEENAQPSFKKNALKYGIIGLAAGLVIALLIVFVLDFRKRRIKSAQNVEAETDIHVIGVLPDQNAQQILSSILLTDPKRAIESIMLLPLKGSHSFAEEIKEELRSASHMLGEKSVDIKVSSPIDDTAFDLTSLDKTDCVILLVRQWDDSDIDLSKTVVTLEYAHISINGILFKRN